MTMLAPTSARPLRMKLIKRMKLRPYSRRTIEAYVSWICRLALFFHCCPSRLSVENIHDLQLDLIDELELS